MENWIDILSEPAIALASRVWKKGKAETWGILSRAIQAENLSQHMPLDQFRQYIKLIANPEFFATCPVCKTPTNASHFNCPTCNVDLDLIRNNLLEEEFKQYSGSPPPPVPKVVSPPTQPILKVEPYRLPPPTLEKRLKKIFDNIAWQPLAIFLCIASFIIGMFLPSTPPSTPTPTFNTTAWMSTAIAINTQQACIDDAMAGVPDEYSRCNPDRKTEPPDEPYYFGENPEDVGEPDSTTPCLIKGNISDTTGERIYHLPGQEFYEKTIIETSQGERWFCTEQEAQAAGWRKSRE